MFKFYLPLLLGAALSVSQAEASLINVTDPNLSGTGLGSVLTIVTAQPTGPGGSALESGCVSWGGSADLIGSCSPGFEGAGGDEKTGSSQTLTRQLSEISGLDTIADIGLVFNINETGQDKSILLDDLYFTVFDQAGAEIFSAFLLPPDETLTAGTGTGTGESGFLYVLDDAQRQAAMSAESTFGGFNGAWRLGGGFVTENFNAGPETMFAFRAPGGDVPSDVPEPATYLLMGGGLLAAASLRRIGAKR